MHWCFNVNVSSITMRQSPAVRIPEIMIAYKPMASEGTWYWEAEGILCNVTKLKNPITVKGSEYGNMV